MNDLFYLITDILAFFSNHGIDKLLHPAEYKTAGSAGERIFYRTLIKKFKIPEEQVLRNVYIPTRNGKTSEIDLILVSKKGIFVFEVKNYGGNIYGDATREKWIQYLGSEKNYFYNPLLQNRNHAKYLDEFLKENRIEIKITPLVTTISRGRWKIKNLGKKDYILGLNCHFKNIYNKMPESESMRKNFNKILKLLTPLSRPDEAIKEKHIRQLKTK